MTLSFASYVANLVSNIPKGISKINESGIGNHILVGFLVEIKEFEIHVKNIIGEMKQFVKS